MSLNSKDASIDILKAVDILYEQGSKNQNSHNPVSSLITPQWHYSESIQILDNDIKINWTNLGQIDPKNTMIDSLERMATRPGEAIIGGIEFERSFCSWYQPYHYLPRDKWGVHLRYDSWIRVSAHFYNNCPNLLGKSLDSLKSAFLYLYVHQLFHNHVENATSLIEILLGKSHIYTKYYSDIYSNVFNTSDCLEEALSNGYLFLWAEECHIDKDFLKDELLKQGPGYQDFIQYYGSSNFSIGNRKLLSQIRYGDLNPTSCDPIEQLLDFSDPIQYSSVYKVPIWLHHKPRPVH